MRHVRFEISKIVKAVYTSYMPRPWVSDGEQLLTNLAIEIKNGKNRWRVENEASLAHLHINLVCTPSPAFWRSRVLQICCSMATNPSTRMFHTFHSSTTSVPTEVTEQIIHFAIADTPLIPLGGGVTAHHTHPSTASVSRIFRTIYLNLSYTPAVNGRAVASPVKLRIGQALDFKDLRTLAAYFENGPGRNALSLRNIRFLSVSYLNDHSGLQWRRTFEYAYEAFECLLSDWTSMDISWLHLCLSPRAISSINDPGMWTLSKIRNLRHFTILGPYGCIAPDLWKYLNTRTCAKTLFPWRQSRVGNIEEEWKIGHIAGGWQKQYESLDARYKFLHHRPTVIERREKQREAYRKRRNRYPLLFRRRKRHHTWRRGLKSSSCRFILISYCNRYNIE